MSKPRIYEASWNTDRVGGRARLVVDVSECMGDQVRVACFSWNEAAPGSHGVSVFTVPRSRFLELLQVMFQGEY